MPDRLCRWLALAAMLVAVPVTALEGDRDQPAYIRADNVELDDPRGVVVYSGSVYVEQGSARLRADHVTVYSANGTVTRVVAHGSPVHFQIKVQKGDPDTHVYGNSVEYSLAQDLVRVQENARVVRQKNSISGARIEYRIANEAIEVFSADGRVKTHLVPASWEKSS